MWRFESSRPSHVIMKKEEVLVKRLLSSSGIELNGNNPWDIRVNDKRFYHRVVKDGSLGFGESYMDGWWDCERIDDCVYRLLRAGIKEKVRGSLALKLLDLKARLFNLQNIRRARQVGKRHYDIGNDLYSAMLGRTMAYSCAYWKNADNLDDAQEAKLELVCKKINIKEGMDILDIGCGWGSFARYAAKRYGVRVTGITISKKQLELGKKLCKGLPIKLRFQDYRKVKGKYDAVVSIGTFEHIGYKNYRTYMEVTNRCLKDDGISLIQTIGSNTSSTHIDPWIDKYIFPNAMLPSVAQIGGAMEGIFVMEDLHNFGPDYDKTLLAWYENFEAAWHELKKKYDERFRRMWRFYLLSTAGGFRARYQQLWQIVMTKEGRPLPKCRFS